MENITRVSSTSVWLQEGSLEPAAKSNSPDRSPKNWSEETVAPISAHGISIIQDPRGYTDIEDASFCESCGGTFYGYGDYPCRNGRFECGDGQKIAGFMIRDEVRPFIGNTELAKDRSWFHITNKTNWHEGVLESNTPIHIGAMDVCQSLGSLNTSGGKRTRDYYLHEVKILEHATIARHLCPDLEDYWSRDISHLSDFTGYVNVFEAPGSISFYGQPTQIEVIRSVHIPAEQWRRFLLQEFENMDDVIEFLEEDDIARRRDTGYRASRW